MAVFSLKKTGRYRHMARYKKGESGNPQGRPKGAKNKTTEGLRNKVIDLIDDNYEQIKKDLAQLQPKERLRFWTDFLKFVLPEKMENTEVSEIQFTEEDIRKIEGEIYYGRRHRYSED
jgi:hypothetical protein